MVWTFAEIDGRRPACPAVAKPEPGQTSFATTNTACAGSQKLIVRLHKTASKMPEPFFCLRYGAFFANREA